MSQSVLSVGEYPRFLAERRVLLARARNEYPDSLISADEATAQQADEITALVADGEHEGLELKSTLRWDLKLGAVSKEIERSVLETVAGLLDSKEGGRLLIGVSDDGDVLGLEPDDASLRKEAKDDRDLFELHPMQALAHRLGESAAAFFTVTYHGIAGKDVCQVTSSPATTPSMPATAGGTCSTCGSATPRRDLPLPEVIGYVGSRWGG